MKITRRQLAEFLVSHQDAKSLKRVAGYLVASGRSKEMELVVREVENVLAKKGRIVARVSSVDKLEADLQVKIVKLIKQQSDAESVEIINQVDPSLLGGVVIRTPEREVDLSIKSRINRLKRA